MDKSRRDFLKTLAAGAIAAAVVPSWGADESAPEQKAPAQPPPLPRRGIHVMSGNRSNMPALERLVGGVAPALGLNWVILEVDNSFQFATHPECAEPDPLTKDDARKLAALARDKGIQLVPQYQCLGHQSWRENTGALLRAHPEFNEAPELDPRAEGFYCMSWCPNHPDLNPLLFDLFDELLDAFQAKALHMGMDEVFVLGQCPRCKGKSNAELFAKAVNDYHAHLVAKRGVEMQMWGDRLLNKEAMHYDGWDNSDNGTWEAVDSVPKDIVMCDWHYGMENPDFPSVRFFQDKGFPVWPSGWNSEGSIRRFIEVARKESGPLMLGYLCTTWTDVTPLVNCLAGEPVQSDDRHLGRVVSGLKLGAQLARGENV
jgi:hypothetical protein